MLLPAWLELPAGIRSLFRIWTPASNQSEGLLVGLLRLGALMTALIVAIAAIWQTFPATRPQGVVPTTFAFWSLTSAFTAFLSGGALGMLFGLPTALHRPDGASGSSSGVASSTGYVESTSLEQVADFLVKGLVALSLTTFDRWSTLFDTVAGNVSAAILGASAASSAPGGLLIAGYALLGFLSAYLWMRRWFIGELVSAQNEQASLLAQRIRAEQDRLVEARIDNRQGGGSAVSGNLQAATRSASSAVAQVVGSLATDEARDRAQAVQDAVTARRDPSDPWKGAFGGLSARNGCVLSANVSPLITDPHNFQLDLLLSIGDDRREQLTGGTAHFFLHPTFGPQPRDVVIGADGQARLELYSYGAFTVGVLLEDGTSLELDLATIAGAPRWFLDH